MRFGGGFVALAVGSGSGTTLRSGGCHHTSLARNCGEGTEATRKSMREDCAKEKEWRNGRSRQSEEGLCGRFLRPLTLRTVVTHRSPTVKGLL
jgi:hypothetical protein